MEKIAEPTQERIVIEEHWNLHYRHAAGPVTSEFFVALRDRGEILGRSCPTCARVLVPPRSFCDRDFVATTEWVKVANEGRLEMFTTVSRKFQGLPEPPYCFGYVLLDGASTAILNYIRGVDLRSGKTPLEVGARMRLVLAPKREGKMSDFWFEPA
jgi:uncharacterized OB-fold protein